MHVVNVIALYTQNSQKDKFYVMCFLLQLPEKKKKGRGGGRGYLCYYFLLLDQIFSVHSLGSPHGQRSLAGYRSMGLQRIRHD